MRWLWVIACHFLLVASQLLLPESPKELCYTRRMTQDVCVCSYEKIVCKCDDDHPILNISRISRHSGKIQISDCVTILQSGAFKGASELHTIIFNHTSLVLSPNSLKFKTNKATLTLVISNSHIESIPSHTIAGNIRTLKLLNTMVGTISSNAFYNLIIADRFEINKSNVSIVENQGFRDVSIQNLEILDSSFSHLATQALNISVKQFAKLKGNSFFQVSSKSLIFGSPSKYLTIKDNHFKNLSAAFIVGATGNYVDVDIEGNTFAFLSKDSFGALQSEHISFTGNTIFSAEPGSLALFFKSVEYKYGNNYFNVVCSCENLSWLEQLIGSESYYKTMSYYKVAVENMERTSWCYDEGRTKLFMEYSLLFCQGFSELSQVGSTALPSNDISGNTSSVISPDLADSVETSSVQTYDSVQVESSDELPYGISSSTVSPVVQHNLSVLIGSTAESPEEQPYVNLTYSTISPSSLDHSAEEFRGNFSNAILGDSFGTNLSANTVIISSYPLSSVSHVTPTVSPMSYVIPTIFVAVLSLVLLGMLLYRYHRRNANRSRLNSIDGTQEDKSWVFAVPDTRIYRQMRVEYVIKELETVTEHIDRPDANNAMLYGSSHRSSGQSSQFYEPNNRQSSQFQDTSTTRSSQFQDTNTRQSTQFQDTYNRQSCQFQDENFRQPNQPQADINR